MLKAISENKTIWHLKITKASAVFLTNVLKLYWRHRTFLMLLYLKYAKNTYDDTNVQLIISGNAQLGKYWLICSFLFSFRGELLCFYFYWFFFLLTPCYTVCLPNINNNLIVPAPKEYCTSERKIQKFIINIEAYLFWLFSIFCLHSNVRNSPAEQNCTQINLLQTSFLNWENRI